MSHTSDHGSVTVLANGLTGTRRRPQDSAKNSNGRDFETPLGLIGPQQGARFVSEPELAALGQRATALSVGGGMTLLSLESMWRGSLRYARNNVTTSGDVRENDLAILRNIRGAGATMWCSYLDDVGLESAIRRAERVLRMKGESGEAHFQTHFRQLVAREVGVDPAKQHQQTQKSDDLSSAADLLVQTVEPYDKPTVFFDTTYNLDAESRAREIAPLLAMARKENLRAAGYIEVSAHGRGLIDTVGRSMYYPYTKAQFSVTVRDPDGTGSGWAGVDFSDWIRINPTRLTEIAMDKCLRSRNPVAVEPGRYTAILEPQAVCDLWAPLVEKFLWRESAESGFGPFAGKDGSKIGQMVVDERVTLSADPMDPDLGFPPFDRFGRVYHPVAWIDKGILRELAYDRQYGIRKLGKNTGLPNSGAFRLSGGTTTVDEMIATTKRGLLVTRLWGVTMIDKASVLCTGYTRDGVWLIENGKISKAVKNFRITESPLFVFNNLEALGTPVRVFRPSAPAVVPPAKVRDFSFTGLSEAV